MIRHLIFLTFKPEIQDADIAAIERGLAALPAKIQDISSFEFGRDIVRSERSCDFALVSSFADLEALKRYQVHPDHQAVLAKVKAACSQIQAVDYEY
ncbi:MAG: Dabb family protein [Deltaproteobacteria bacterium]|nr:Dabb family protein [Candidatus Anaeroferrophillus wilburensis]MBN2887950.1 Dabb family protein [Deltaproteobacteria bacterium]